VHEVLLVLHLLRRTLPYGEAIREKAARVRAAGSRLERNLKFSRLPQVGNTLLNWVERRLGRSHLLSGPHALHVGVTNRCNLQCFDCTRPAKGRDIQSDLIPAVAKASRRAAETVLFGYGEPLIARNFYALLEQVRGGRITFFTNGKVLNASLFERISKEAARPIYEITFSIDGASAPVHESIRIGSDFERVWANIREIQDYKRSRGLRFPRLSLSFVAMRRNVEEIPELLKKAHEYGLENVIVSHVLVWEAWYRDESLLHYPELTRKIFDEARSLADRLGVNLFLPAVLGADFERGATAEIPPCYEPWRKPYIDYGGNVQPCCWAPTLVMGSLRDASFDEIWNGEAFAEFRRRVNSDPPPECLTCDQRFRMGGAPDPEAVYLQLRAREE
jgi:MoaA/NifB/PqqE/SkfB family radical SAM enzyme